MGEASGIREPASSDMLEMQAGTEPLRQTKLRQARGMRTNEACTGQLAVKALVAGRQADRQAHARLTVSRWGG